MAVASGYQRPIAKHMRCKGRQNGRITINRRRSAHQTCDHVLDRGMLWKSELPSCLAVDEAIA